MSITSTYGLNLTLTYALQQQQLLIGELDAQVATGQKYSNLTDYNPTDASTVLTAESAINQRQSYISSMQAVTTRLSVYDSTMTDIESMAQNAGQLATQNAALIPKNLDSIEQQATNYMQNLQDDLNQQVGGRYIYAGTRYSTAPVANLTTLPAITSTTSSPTTSPALPVYDTDYSSSATTSFNINANPPSGNFTIGNISIPWSDVQSGAMAGITVGGSAYTPSPAITGLTTPATTTTQLASNLSLTLNQLATQVPASSGIASLTTTASSNSVSFDFAGTTPQSVTPDSGGSLGETTWAGGTAVAGNTALTPTSGNDTIAINSNPTGSFLAGNVSIAWSQIEPATGATQTINYTVNGTAETVSVSGLSTANTPAAAAQNMSAILNQIATQTTNPLNNISNISSAYTAGSNAFTVTFPTGQPQMITADSGGVASETSWIGGTVPDGTTAQTPSSEAAAYTQDTVLVDQNFQVTYGVSSDDPAFQNLVNGLRYIMAAVTAGKAGDSATYQTDMSQAATLLSTGLTGVQTLHAQVSNNQNIMSSETSTQNADIASLQNQMSNIQSIDISTVGTEINLLQTQLQASYSATATLEKLSLASYL